MRFKKSINQVRVTKTLTNVIKSWAKIIVSWLLPFFFKIFSIRVGLGKGAGHYVRKKWSNSELIFQRDLKLSFWAAVQRIDSLVLPWVNRVIEREFLVYAAKGNLQKEQLYFKDLAAKSKSGKWFSHTLWEYIGRFWRRHECHQLCHPQKEVQSKR